MKLQLFALLVIASVLLVDANIEKSHKHKKYSGHHKHKDAAAIHEAEERHLELLKKQEEKHAQEIADEIAKQQRENLDNNNPYILVDPCAKMTCDAGSICTINEETGLARCSCIETCPEEEDPRRKICSNFNETWGSDCELYQQRCWCQHKDERCSLENLHTHINYYGACREMPECTKDELEDFPRRMRDWLFNIMRDLADRHELNPHYMKMERESENNQTLRWINAAIWKWCDLDTHLADRKVSRHELFPIRAPLMALEHCIKKFLDDCDEDNDHFIDLKEWGSCLQVGETDLQAKCEDFADTKE